MSATQEAGDAPVWLADEPELDALLHAALDRFDRQPAQARQRDIFLPAEQHLPSLARADAAADQLWRLIGELQARGVVTIRRARRNAFDADWKGARLAFSRASEAILRQWLRRDRSAPLERWREAVVQHAQLFPGGCEALLARRIVIEGRSVEETRCAG
jgi:hypothetical protein